MRPSLRHTAPAHVYNNITVYGLQRQWLITLRRRVVGIIIIIFYFAPCVDLKNVFRTHVGTLFPLRAALKIHQTRRDDCFSNRLFTKPVAYYTRNTDGRVRRFDSRKNPCTSLSQQQQVNTFSRDSRVSANGNI